MKRLLLILITLTALGITHCIAEDQVFSKLPIRPEIEKIYIGKELLKVAGDIASRTGSKYGVTLGPKSQLESIEIVEVHTQPLVTMTYNIMKEYIAGNNLDTLVTKQDGYDWTAIYGKFTDDSRAKILIICVYEVSEMQVVVLKGDFSITNVR